MASITNSGLLDTYASRNFINSGVDATNLVAYYKLDAGALTTDSKGTNTLTNNNTVAEATGKFLGGANFALPANSRSLSAGNLGISGTGDISISFWVKLNNEIGTGTWGFFNHRNAATGNRYILCGYEYNGGTRRIYAQASGTTHYSAGALGTTWHHVVVTRNVSGNALITYIDGVQTGTGALGTNAISENHFILGTDSVGNFLDAIIDDVAVFNDVLTATEIGNIYRAGNGECVGYWKLDGNANDSSVNSYNLTGTAPSYVAGIYDQAGDFELSSSQYLTIADASAPKLEITGSRTISAWVNLESVGIDQTVFGHDDATNGFLLYVTSGNKATFTVRGLTTATSISSSASLSASTWYHIVGVYDSANTKIKVFLNGIKAETTASGASVNSAADYSIGARDKGATVDFYFDGIIDDVAIFNRALTDEEVLSIYNSFIPKIMII